MSKEIRRALAGFLALCMIGSGIATGSYVYADEDPADDGTVQTEVTGEEPGSEEEEVSDTATDENDKPHEDPDAVADIDEHHHDDDDDEEESSSGDVCVVYEEVSPDEASSEEAADKDDEQLSLDDDAEVDETEDGGYGEAAEPGAYNFGTDWTRWAQSGFEDYDVRKGGCRMVAYSKMLVQTGAVPMEAVEKGYFNPGVFYDWCVNHGWISGAISEVSPPGTCPVRFAEDVYGSVLSVEKIDIGGWSNDERRSKIVEYVGDDYSVILGSNAHFVCVDSDKTKEENYPYLSESYSGSLGATVRVENGNHPLSTYTNMRKYKCTSGPTKDPGPFELISEGKCGDNLTWTLEKVKPNSEQYDIRISGTGDMWDWEEPIYDGRHISQMPPWMQNKQNALGKDVYFSYRKLILEEGITSIGDNAFNQVGFYATYGLTIPSTVTRIGDRAFYSCNFNGSISIPGSVKEIGDYAFASCSSFNGTLTIPASVEKIGKSAFFDCCNLSGISFGEGSKLTEIPNGCFEYCFRLTGNIILPDSITRIGESAFAQNYYDDYEDLPKKVKLPAGLKEMGAFAFQDNRNMTIDGPILPDGLEKTGQQIFRGCKSITGELVVPESLKEVEYWSFRDCKGLTKVTFNEGTKRIGVAAFYGCENLTGELNFPKGLNSISEAAFKNCKKITGLTFPERMVGDYSALTLGPAAFEGCSGLTGDLVLSKDDVHVWQDNCMRTFMGTNYSRVILKGKWYESDAKSIRGVGAIGSYYTSAEQKENRDFDYGATTNIPVTTFPAGVTICYEDKFYIDSRKNGEYGSTEKSLRTALQELGYGSVKSFSEVSDVSSDVYYVTRLDAYDYTTYLNTKTHYSIGGCNPSWADDAGNLRLEVSDPTVAEIIKSDIGNYWEIVPKKVGKTEYTVNFHSDKYGDFPEEKGFITVLPNDKVIREIRITAGNETSVGLGDTLTLKTEAEPSTVKDKSVTWKSSDPSIVSVTAKGVIKGVSEGKATITATSKANTDISDSCEVTVTVKKYNISFVYNGGTLTSKGWWEDHGDLWDTAAKGSEAVFIHNLEAVTSMPVVEKEGCLFGGWTTDPTGYNLVKSLQKDHKGDLTLYAKLTPWSYTVKYDPSSTKASPVTGKMKATTSSYGSDLVLNPVGFVKKGYRLTGWSLSKNAVVPDAELSGSEIELAWDEIPDSLKPAANKDVKTLYAVWKESPYSIEYVLNGGSIPAGYEDTFKEEYTYGASQALPTPEREGYAFGGWFSDAALKKQVKSIGTKTSGNLRLYAKWSAAYRVVLHDDEGADKTYLKYTYGRQKALPANPYKKAGSAFMGWATVSGGNAVYANKQKVVTPELTAAEDGVLQLDLYSVWQENFTILDVDLRGGDFLTGEKNVISKGDTYSYSSVTGKKILLPKKMKREGYSFLGWYDRDTGKKVTQITKANCKDYSFYAKWKPLKTRVMYKANPPKKKKATGRMATQVLTYDDGGRLAVNRYAVKGYRFAGWSTVKNGGAEYQDYAVYEPGSYKKSVTLYAVWLEIE